MPAALALSPHLDDAVFSCGGLLAQLADAGWRVVMATAFTATVLPSTGFALACQLDKGLAPDVDYMALRRAEDAAAAAILGMEPRWLNLSEAPHRGYGSAAALFGALQEDDEVWRPLAAGIAALLTELQPDLVLAPQGLGGHVDHRQMIRAVQHLDLPAVSWYRDTPYAIRSPTAEHALDTRQCEERSNPGPLALGSLPWTAFPKTRADGWTEYTVPIAAGLDRKIAASCSYSSQIGFQFGGSAKLALALQDFARQEGQGVPAERFLGRLASDRVQP